MGGPLYNDLITQVPALGTAGQNIASQLQAEGADQSTIGSVQQSLADTFSQLTDQAGQFALTAVDQPGGAIDTAQKYIRSAYTLAGSVEGITSSIIAGQPLATPAQVDAAGKLVVGTFIGLATAAGALSAGVGAAIVAGVGIALDVLTSAGLFGPPVVDTVCGTGLTYVPSIVVGCAYSQSAGARVPGSANWRTFPSKTRPSDAGWFTQGVYVGIDEYLTATSWYGDQWWGGFARSNARLIDRAFPNYAQLESENLVPPNPGAPLTIFKQGFFTAWRANQAFALNGLKPQDDWQIFSHYVGIWNKTHDGSSDAVLIPPNSSTFGYEGSLIEQIVNLSPNDSSLTISPSTGQQMMKVNLGPLLTVPVVPQKPITPGFSLSSPAAKGVMVGAGLSVGGLAVYSHVTGIPFMTLIKGALRR